eukprot:288671-Rhodomonas_salina.1
MAAGSDGRNEEKQRKSYAKPDDPVHHRCLTERGQTVTQLVRVAGWNKATYSVAKHVDMVYNVTALLSLLVNRFTFFGLAFLMVVFAVGDAFYCAWLFKAGDINKIGPIKALRFMVAVVVTTLFSSVMKWYSPPPLSSPVADPAGMSCLGTYFHRLPSPNAGPNELLFCHPQDEGNFSENFHGEGAPCTPWGIPELFFTVPTLIIVVLYFFFAVTVAFFSLGTNPLSCAPHVQFTGRIEALFILSKVPTPDMRPLPVTLSAARIRP